MRLRSCRIAPLVLGCVLPSQQATVHDLQRLPKVGETFWFVATETQRRPLAIASKTAPWIKSANITFLLEVEKAENATHRTHILTPRRLHGLVRDAAGRPRNFDTQADPSPPSHESCRELLQAKLALNNQRFQATVDASANVQGHLQVRNGKEVSKASRSQVAEVLPLFRAVLGHRPGKHVAQGESWPGESQRRFADAAWQQKTRLTLASIDTRACKLAVEGEFTGRVSPLLFVEEDSLTGSLRLSPTDGLMLSSRIVRSTTLASGQGEQPKSIRLQTTERLRRIKGAELGILGALVTRNVQRSRDEAKRLTAEMNAKTIANAVRMYYASHGKMPANLQTLTREGGELLAIVDDPWGQPYRFVDPKQASKFAIVSSGPDRRPGTEDDVSSRRSR